MGDDTTGVTPSGRRASGPRCIALVGPFQSGKTTLLEAILERTGAIPRMGSVDAGTTVSDASAEARQLRMSVEAGFATTRFMGDDYTFVDCPGSIDALQDMRQRGDDRLDLLEDFIAANDLIESNVVGAMNSDIAYFRGFSAGAQKDMGLDEADIMREVWAGEPEARAQVMEWVYGFSALAYQPLDEDEFDAYIAFGKTDAGRALNTAVFAAFDNVYADLARGLGAGTALLIQTFDGQEL